MAGLVEAAIIDARLLDHSTYSLHADHWCCSGNPPYCEVGLAGSLIVGRLNFPPGRTVSSRTFNAVTQVKLDALDSIRLGVYHRAFKLLHNKEPTPRITELLRFLPKPLCSCFCGWAEFNAHLDSLRGLLLEFRAIDEQAARL